MTPDYQIKQFDVLMQVRDDQKRGIAFLAEAVHNEVAHSWSEMTIRDQFQFILLGT